jgi:hypothetical protein
MKTNERRLAQLKNVIDLVKMIKTGEQTPCSVTESDEFDTEVDEGRRRTLCSNPGRDTFNKDGGGEMTFGAYSTDGR